VDRPTFLLRTHEVMTALNLGTSAVAFLMIGNHPVSRYLVQMDFAILHRRNPYADFTYGYWAFFLPSIATAILVWLLLRLTAESNPTRFFLRNVAGPIAVIAPTAWDVSISYFQFHEFLSDVWTRLLFFETLVALLLVTTLSAKRPAGRIARFAVVVVHFSIWVARYHFDFRSFMGYIGVAPIVGLAAAMTWLLYRECPSAAPSHS
jgi:hypothetical protein